MFLDGRCRENAILLSNFMSNTVRIVSQVIVEQRMASPPVALCFCGPSMGIKIETTTEMRFVMDYKVITSDTLA